MTLQLKKSFPRLRLLFRKKPENMKRNFLQICINNGKGFITFNFRQWASLGSLSI